MNTDLNISFEIYRFDPPATDCVYIYMQNIDRSENIFYIRYIKNNIIQWYAIEVDCFTNALSFGTSSVLVKYFSGEENNLSNILGTLLNIFPLDTVK